MGESCILGALMSHGLVSSPLSGSARRTYLIGEVPAVRLGSPDLRMGAVPAVRLGSPDLQGLSCHVPSGMCRYID